MLLPSKREEERGKLRKRGKRGGEWREHTARGREGRRNRGGSVVEGEEEKRDGKEGRRR